MANFEQHETLPGQVPGGGPAGGFSRTDGSDRLAAAAVDDADLRDVAAALWREAHAHPADASCECLALVAIGRLLMLGYRIGRPLEDGGIDLSGPWDVARCIGCGCTEDSPCPGGCSWVPGGTADICSVCAAVITGIDEPQRAALCALTACHVDKPGDYAAASDIAAGMVARAWSTGNDGARSYAKQLVGLGLAERESGRRRAWRATRFGRYAVEAMHEGYHQ